MKRVLKILLFFLVLANAGCTTERYDPYDDRGVVYNGSGTVSQGVVRYGTGGPHVIYHTPAVIHPLIDRQELSDSVVAPRIIELRGSNLSGNGDGGQSQQSQVRKKPRRGTGSSSSPGYLPPEKKNDAGSQDALVRPKDVEKL